jgi:hypothetical protein
MADGCQCNFLFGFQGWQRNDVFENIYLVLKRLIKKEAYTRKLTRLHNGKNRGKQDGEPSRILRLSISFTPSVLSHTSFLYNLDEVWRVDWKLEINFSQI